jgi:hypothetical protein
MQATLLSINQGLETNSIKLWSPMESCPMSLEEYTGISSPSQTSVLSSADLVHSNCTFSRFQTALQAILMNSITPLSLKRCRSSSPEIGKGANTDATGNRTIQGIALPSGLQINLQPRQQATGAEQILDLSESQNHRYSPPCLGLFDGHNPRVRLLT